MNTETSAAKKSTAVEHLTFGAKTARRVAWESWEFTVLAPHLIEVANASYGYLKGDHTYRIGIEIRDGYPVPAECDCPADIHHDADCKHKVALATIGGKTVLNAAVNFENPAAASSDSDPVTAAGVKTDGGAILEDPGETEEGCPNGQARCGGPDGDDLPCFDCYQPEDN